MSPQTAALATAINNDGISYLELENYEAAAASFSKGLSLVKQVLSSNIWGAESESSDSADGPECQFCKLHSNDSVLADDSDIGQEPTLREESFVFREPIMVLACMVETPSYSFFVKLSYIQLYNLALSHHLCGLKRSKSQSFLRKALVLYELAYTIYISEDVQLTLLQSMAIVNNMGHLHKSMDNIEKSKQFFENLLATLMFVKDCGEHDDFQMLDVFILNVMSLILKGCKAAAAA